MTFSSVFNDIIAQKLNRSLKLVAIFKKYVIKHPFQKCIIANFSDTCVIYIIYIILLCI